MRPQKTFLILLFASECFGDNFLQQFFTNIYNIYSVYPGLDSASGTGSDLIQTKVIRDLIPRIIEEFNIRTLIDAPCGDFFWMKTVNLAFLDRYLGLDIVTNLIEKNKLNYSSDKINFVSLDLTNSSLPYGDLILCRDCLVHLSFENIFLILKNFKKSNSRYLLTTTFTNRTSNSDIADGGWRPLNLEKPPFNFPKPILLINENCSEGGREYSDKSLGLWSFENIIIY